MAKRPMSQEEQDRWRKIVFMDDRDDKGSANKRTQPYVYGQPTRKSHWWQRVLDRVRH